MGMESPDDIDRASIEEHSQRTVEQTALRKVRRALDGIEEAEAAERRSLRKVVILCVILALVVAWLFLGLTYSDRGIPKQSPMQVPDKVPQKQ